MMNLNKYLKAAKENNIEPFEISLDLTKSTNIAFFDGQIENFTVAEDSSVYGRGIYDGKIGAFRSDSLTKDIPEMMATNIRESAVYGRPGDPDLFVKSGLKYRKPKMYHPALANLGAEELTALFAKVYEGVKQIPGVSEVRGEVAVIETSSVKQNSLGLKLAAKSNYLEISVELSAKDGTEVESGFDVAVLTDLTDFDPVEFGRKVALETRSKLHGTSVESGKYPIVLSPLCVAGLLKPLLSQLSAFQIQHHVSLFEKTLGTKTLSRKLTVESKPISNSVFASSYDDEGTPKQNMALVKNGVIVNYLYDLETAKKDGVSSNGCGTSISSNVRPAVDYLVVKPGRKSFDQLISGIKRGIYITQLTGENAGLDPLSGNYSLQASGKLIENGRLTTPVSLITVAGNLIDTFQNIIDLANDTTETYRACQTPAIAIKKLSVSGSK